MYIVSKFKLSSLNLIVVVVCKSCKGDFEVFMSKLVDTLEALQSYPEYRVVLYRDCNTIFLCFSNECSRNPDEFLCSFVTVDGRWIYWYTPETKE